MFTGVISSTSYVGLHNEFRDNLYKNKLILFKRIWITIDGLISPYIVLSVCIQMRWFTVSLHFKWTNFMYSSILLLWKTPFLVLVERKGEEERDIERGVERDRERERERARVGARCLGTWWCASSVGRNQQQSWASNLKCLFPERSPFPQSFPPSHCYLVLTDAMFCFVRHID